MRFTLGAIYEVLKHRKFAATVAYLPAARCSNDSAKAVSTLICSDLNMWCDGGTRSLLTRPSRLYISNYMRESHASRPHEYPTGADGNSLGPFGAQQASTVSRVLMLSSPLISGDSQPGRREVSSGSLQQRSLEQRRRGASEQRPQQRSHSGQLLIGGALSAAAAGAGLRRPPAARPHRGDAPGEMRHSSATWHDGAAHVAESAPALSVRISQRCVVCRAGSCLVPGKRLSLLPSICPCWISTQAPALRLTSTQACACPFCCFSPRCTQANL